LARDRMPLPRWLVCPSLPMSVVVPNGLARGAAFVGKRAGNTTQLQVLGHQLVRIR